MARGTITPQDVSSDGVIIAGTGVSETTGDAVNGHAFTNDGRVYLQARNSGASSYDVTIATPGTVDGNAVADKVVSVAAGVTKVIGPFPMSAYNQSDNTVNVDVSNAALMLLALQA